MTDIEPTLSRATDTSFEQERRQYRVCVESVRSANKTALFDALAQADITRVIVEFDGYGDSGQIEYVQAFAGDERAEPPESQIEIAQVRCGEAIERSRLPIAEAIEQLAYDFLEQVQDGWENNDGAYGEFTFHVAARMITLDFNERVSDSVHSQHTF